MEEKLAIEDWIIEFWKSILVLGLALSYFIWLAAPDVTWINTDSDSGIYIWSTTNWGLSHPTGAPLYNIVGNFLNQGASVKEAAQHLALLSAVCASLTTLILYLDNRSYFAPGVFLASGLVVSQSTIIETYAPVTLFIALSWYWRKNKYLFPISIALGLGIHHLIGISGILLVFFRHKFLKQNTLKTDLLIIPLGLFSYIYVFLALKPEDAIWSEVDWRSYFFGQSFLTGGLDPVESGPQRLRDFFLVFVGGLGLAIIPLLRLRDVVLISLILAFVIYYVTNLAPQTYVYLYPSFFFAAIAIGRMSYGEWTKIALSLNITLLIIYNIGSYDIGRNLDPSPTSARIYLNELSELPENSIVFADRRGWETVLSWNVDDGPKVISHPDLLKEYLEESNRSVTHNSRIIDNTRYLSIIEPCVIGVTCKYGGD